MTPQVRVHRPHGVIPKISVRKRTVVDYQPSWLLFGAPAALVWAARRRARSEVELPVTAGSATASPAATSPVGTPSVDLPPGPADTGRSGRRRPVQIVVVSLSRLRRKPISSQDLDDVSDFAPHDPSTTVGQSSD